MLKKELILHGPFVACYSLNEDFFHYNSGKSLPSPFSYSQL